MVAVHFNHPPTGERVSAEEVIGIRGEHNIWQLLRRWSDVPPKERLWELPAMASDIVAFSVA